MLMFHGSYLPSDVTFLLKQVQIADTPIQEKEKLIQKGIRHYSEMLTREKLPTPRYMKIYNDALQREKNRFALDVIILAYRILERIPNDIVIVSLARAGTPIGVLLQRFFQQCLGKRSHHYSISIIRDRGIDHNAMHTILKQHDPASIQFVDGWTGKGVITEELTSAVEQFNQQFHVSVDPGLAVISDLAGVAAFTANQHDYLIPSCILGATISGLISRSILNADLIGPDDFHGAVFYSEFGEADQSLSFVDEMMKEIKSFSVKEFQPVTCRPQAEQRQRMRDFLAEITKEFGVQNRNFIKPGIGESTRVLLRRVPNRLLVAQEMDKSIYHLLELAEEKRVPVEVRADLPFAATALIEEVEG